MTPQSAAGVRRRLTVVQCRRCAEVRELSSAVRTRRTELCSSLSRAVLHSAGGRCVQLVQVYTTLSGSLDRISYISSADSKNDKSFHLIMSQRIQSVCSGYYKEILEKQLMSSKLSKLNGQGAITEKSKTGKRHWT